MIKNHDKESLKEVTYKGLSRFFGDKLNSLYSKNIIQDDCITARNRLNNVLTKMLEMRILKKYVRGKKITYKFESDFQTENIRNLNKIALDFYPVGDVFSKDILGSDMCHIIYGLSKTLHSSFKESDREQLNTELRNIAKSIDAIEKLKFKYTPITFIRKFNTLVSRYIIDEELQKFWLNPLNSFLLILAQGGGIEKFHIKVTDLLGKELSDKEKDYLKENIEDNYYSINDKFYGMSFDKADKFREMVSKELSSLKNVQGIAYSYYQKFGIIEKPYGENLNNV